MSPDEYQKLAHRTECDHEQALQRLVLHHTGGGGWPKGMSMRLLHSVIGMMGELGELAGALEKWIWYGQPFDETNFKEELGDTNWYQAEALNALEAKFEDVLKRNIDKLKARYPDKYTDEAALNRDLEKERTVLEAPVKMGHDFSQGDRCSRCSIPKRDSCLGPCVPVPLKKGGPYSDAMDRFYDTVMVDRRGTPNIPSPVFNECNEAGFIEPPEEPEKEERDIIKYPLNDAGMIDTQGWTFGMPTEPGDYEWFSPIHSLAPSKITTPRNYSGEVGSWGRDVFWRKVPPHRLGWKYGFPTEPGDYEYSYTSQDPVRKITDWKPSQGWGTPTYYRKVSE